MAGSLQVGVWYAPTRSLAELVREGFRHDHFAGCRLGGAVTASSLGSEDRLAERRDVAFSALRQLHSNLQFGQRVLTGRHIDDDIASYLHSTHAAVDGCADATVLDDEDVMVGDGTLKLKETPLHCGGLLIAHPLQCSGAFWRTVLLVCTYDKQQGAMALVLNRSTGKRLGDVVSSQHLAASRLLQMFAEHPLFYGGPVAPNALFYLHTVRKCHSTLAFCWVFFSWPLLTNDFEFGCELVATERSCRRRGSWRRNWTLLAACNPRCRHRTRNRQWRGDTGRLSLVLWLHRLGTGTTRRRN